MDIAEAKAALRGELRARRAAMPASARSVAGAALAARANDLDGSCVAAFVAVRTEPPTLELIEAMRRRGVRVLLPLLRVDLDLEWAEYAGAETLAAGPRGLLQPNGPSLGREGLREASLVLCPALAADRSGRRLGQGGGSYDRALGRTTAPVFAIVYDDELLPLVPAEPHDRRIDGVLTPAGGVTRFAPS